jgi:hypothetical protein
MEGRRTVGDFHRKLAQLFEDPDAVPIEEMSQWRAPVAHPRPRNPDDDPDVGCIERPTTNDIEATCMPFKYQRKRRDAHSSFLPAFFRRFRDRDVDKSS